MAVTTTECAALMTRLTERHGAQVTQLAVTRSLVDRLLTAFGKQHGADVRHHKAVIDAAMGAKLRADFGSSCMSALDAADDDLEVMQETIAYLDAIPD